MLQSWRMKPVAVEGARQALAELRRVAGAGAPYPLVLLDSQMPDVDGFALAGQIRAEPALAGVSILMLVSSDRQGSGERCREAGVSACLMKPVKQSELLDTILELLHGREGRLPAAVLPAAPAPAPGPGRPLRILLAEDHPVNQMLAARILEKGGHAVTVAGNGKEALAALEKGRFDLVLMDLEMPELGGFEATARIREKERGTGAHIPILALTAHAMKGDRERCLRGGMDGYVAKPILARELYQAIAELIPAGPGSGAAAGPARPEAAPAPKPGPPILDCAAALEHVGGDRELFHELIEVFLLECPKMLAEVGEAARAGDAARLKRAAHSIKGAVGTLGGKAAFEAALRLETIGRQGDLREVQPARQTLEKAIVQLQQALGTAAGGV
jgi:CheY-like chemotaxis protein/HPt (histidine-containing phosphotransfer) domain-containing protein